MRLLDKLRIVQQTKEMSPATEFILPPGRLLDALICALEQREEVLDLWVENDPERAEARAALSEKGDEQILAHTRGFLDG